MLNNSQDSSVVETREEYLNKLKQWLEEARLWHSVYTTNLSYSYPNVHSPYYINGTAVPTQSNPSVNGNNSTYLKWKNAQYLFCTF